MADLFDSPSTAPEAPRPLADRLAPDTSWSSPRATTRALRLRAQAALPLAALVDRLPVGLAGLRVTELAVLLPADPRLARLARGLPVALAGLLLAVEPVAPPRLALEVKAPQRRRF